MNPIKGALEGVEFSRDPESALEAGKPRHAAPAPAAPVQGGATAAASQPEVAEPIPAQITFEVDSQLREAIIKIVDPKSHDVIREIPSEEAQRVARAYLETQHEHAARSAK